METDEFLHLLHSLKIFAHLGELGLQVLHSLMDMSQYAVVRKDLCKMFFVGDIHNKRHLVLLLPWQKVRLSMEMLMDVNLWTEADLNIVWPYVTILWSTRW